ncbi:hypothetical protein [Massilia niastensis]|uniref:hypothetical protein n=1 Tax=Massilia niastensis TaxID=544911 RepID=UPI0012EB1350|nr:hypothetical protein [Massilia niastensis]
MKLKLWAAIGAVLAVPFAAQAQQSHRAADPADPDVVVPPTVYESAIAGYSPLVQDTQATPDKSWRAANEAVARSQGHAGHGAHHGAESGQAHGASAPPAAPAKPATPASPAPADHSKHHQAKTDQ